MDREALVYHYTDARAMLSIVTTRKLWATSVEFVNDRFEGNLVRRRLRHMLEHPSIFFGSDIPPPRERDLLLESLNTFRHASTVSFSRDANSLTQFRMYCPPRGGFVIGLPKEVLRRIGHFTECDYSEKRLDEWCHSHLHAYVQWRSQLPDDVDRVAFMRAFGQSSLFNDREDAAVRFKASEFVAEYESRLVDRQWCDKFRPSRDGNLVIPYIEIDIPNESFPVLIAPGPSVDEVQANLSAANLCRAGRLANTQWDFHQGGGMYSYRVV